MDKLFCEASLFFSGVRAPENVGTVACHEFVVAIGGRCMDKRWVTRHHAEKNDSNGEEVNLLAGVRLFGVDFWSHVALGTDLRSEVSTAIAAYDRRGKTEVSEAEVVVLVDEDILRL